MKNLIFTFFLLVLTVKVSQAQEKESYSRKGEYFVYWGYNRSFSYSESDIRFRGIGYDFTLYKAVAADAPTPIQDIGTYLNPGLLSIPQFNFRAGYFFNDHWCLSLGWDHMKYVVQDWQKVAISGHISPQVSDPAITVDPKYVGDFTKEANTVVLDPDHFLHLEHTDGFNYAALELDRYDRLWTAKNKKLSLDWLAGMGAGAMVPRSDVHLFGVGANHFWNISGYGFSAKAGLRFDFSKRLFFQTDVKYGFSRLNNIPTTGRDTDYAQQSIWWGEFYGVLGYKFGRHRKNK